MKNFIEELEWRGMIHTVMPGADEELKKGMASAYLGIDPTADSLHIGLQLRKKCDGSDRGHFLKHIVLPVLTQIVLRLGDIGREG